MVGRGGRMDSSLGFSIGVQGSNSTNAVSYFEQVRLPNVACVSRVLLVYPKRMAIGVKSNEPVYREDATQAYKSLTRQHI